MKDVSGRVNFNGFNLSSFKPINGRLLGEPWTMDLSPNRIRISGDFDFSELGKRIKIPFFNRISGKAPVIVAIDMQKVLSMEIRSYLKLVTLNLPAPLFKAEGQRLPFMLTLNQMVLSKTVPASEEERASDSFSDSLFQGNFSLGSLLKGAYQVGPDLLNLHATFSPGLSQQENDSTAGLESLSLEPLLVSPFKKNILVDGGVAKLELGAWISLLSESFPSSFANTEKQETFFNIEGVHSKLAISVNVLQFFSQRWAEVQLGVGSENQEPMVTFKADKVDGGVFLASPIQANFKTLYLQGENLGSGALVNKLPLKQSFLSPDDFKKIPAFWLQIENLYWNNRKLGSLSLNSFPVSSGVAITNGHFDLPFAEINFSGDYLTENESPILRASIEARATDFGQTLRQLGVPGILNKTRGALVFEGCWKGGVSSPDLSTLSGVLGIELFDGTLLNIDSPVVSRLLGLFSIESLAKHLSLNFTDMQQKGFMFGEISGGYSIKNGVASTSGLLINGPNLRVNLTGDIDLVNKTMNQTVVALPNIDGGVALAAGLIGGPLLGVMAWVTDRVLTNTVLKDRGIVYQLKGPWGKETV